MFRNVRTALGLDAARMQYNRLVPFAQELLEILVCPVCKQAVMLTAEGDGLRCSSCRRVYPIIDDIPVMLVDRARQE